MSTYSITLSDLGASRPPGRPSQCRGTGRTPVRQVSGREHLPGRGLPGGCAPRCRADSVSRFAFPHAPRLTCSARPNFENKDGLNLFGRTLRLARIVIRVTAWPRRPGKADRKPATMRLAAHRLVWPGGWEGPSPHHRSAGVPRGHCSPGCPGRFGRHRIARSGCRGTARPGINRSAGFWRHLYMIARIRPTGRVLISGSPGCARHANP